MKSIQISLIPSAFALSLSKALAQTPRLPSTARLRSWQSSRHWEPGDPALLIVRHANLEIQLRVSIHKSPSEVDSDLLRWSNRPVQTRSLAHRPVKKAGRSLSGAKVADYFVGPQSQKQPDGGVFQIEAARVS